MRALFFSRLLEKTDARVAGSLSQIVINGTEVETYRIEMFTERNDECEDITRFISWIPRGI